MNFYPSLLTKEALKLEKWSHVEWFGYEERYVPYVYMVDDYYAYSKADEHGSFSLDIQESFPYLLAYKEGEFLASFELPFITLATQVLDVRDFKLTVDTAYLLS